MIGELDWLRLSTASREGRAVNIQGVGFVLSDPRLDMWKLEPAVVLGQRRSVFEGPALVFPWTEPDEVEILNERGAVRALPGDLLLIDKLKKRSITTRYGEDDDPSNRWMWVAELALLRSGELIAVPGQWLLHEGRATIRPGITSGENRIVEEALFERIEDRCGFDIRDYLGKEVEDWPAIPAQLTQPERRAILALVDAADRDASGGWEDGAVAFGYWMGRAEAEASLAASAESHREALRTSRTSGAKGARVSVVRADIRWRGACLQIAIRLRRENPALSQAGLLDAMLGEPDFPAAAPGPDTIMEAIKRWEAAGSLPRSTKYRAPARKVGG